MRLVACQACHTQYDIAGVAREQIDCRCGARVEVRELESKDLEIHRCSSCGAHVAVGDDGCEYCGSPIVRDPRLLSLICPGCCARNAPDARYCAGCGGVFDPQPIDEPLHELRCPVCGCLMSARSVGGVGIDECPKCNGIWCPEDRFEALVQRALEARRDASGAATDFAPRVKGSNPVRQGVEYRKCPVCDGFMGRRNFRKTSGVIVDRCHEHGCWLDADELEQIAGYLLSGGRPQAEAAMRHAEARDREEIQRARLQAAASGRDAPLLRGLRAGEREGWGSISSLLASLFD